MHDTFGLKINNRNNRNRQEYSMAKKTPKPTKASKKVESNAVPVLNSVWPTGQSERLLVDSTQDIAVLRQKHESVNRWVQALEQIRNRLNRKIEICQIDVPTQRTFDRDEFDQFLRTISNEVTELFTKIDVESLISEDIIHARSMFQPDTSGFSWRAIETPTENASQVDQDQVEALWQFAAAIIALISRGLDPALRYRDEIEQVLQQRQIDSTSRSIVRERGRPKDVSLLPRNKRIRQLNKMNNGKSPAEVAHIANQDADIQRLGLKKPITKHIVREVLNPTRKRGRK